MSSGYTPHSPVCICMLCKLGYTKDWLTVAATDNSYYFKPEVTPLESVDHPPHYVDGRTHEPVDVILDWKLSYALGNVVKYIARAGRKGDALEDLRKAKFYLEREITRLSEV